MGFTSRALVSALGSAATVLAHGHVNNIVVNGVFYPGYDVTKYPYQNNPPTVVGWSATNTDNGFVEPNNFGHPDIICHRGAQPAKGHARVRAGDKILLQWDTWPDSHKGPVLDYLARCEGNCESVDKTALRFFKIGQGSYISGAAPGHWAADVLIDNGFSWVVQIPEDVAPGNYVLRHEIIALHGSPNPNGAQAYPQCFNLEISGSGSRQPAGVAGTALYEAGDPGIRFPLYNEPINYPVPGPALIAGVPSTVAQVSTRATATSSPFLPGGGGGNPGPTSAPGGGNGGGGGGGGNPQPPQTTTPPGNGNGGGGGGGQTRWGQCGGSGWNGPTACAQGSCSTLNPYYAQCV